MLSVAVVAALVSLSGVYEPSASRALASQTSPLSPSPSAASADSARKWLTLIDQQNWSESWREAGTLFRSHISIDAWASAIIPVRRPLGAVISRSLASVTKATSLPGAPTGEYELLEFHTDFAAKKEAIETVVLAKEQVGWRVDGYFIR